jgi:putative addiction module killer protein
MRPRMDWAHFRPRWLSWTWNQITVGRYYPEERHPVSRVLFAVYDPVCRFVLRWPKATIAAALALMAATVPVNTPPCSRVAAGNGNTYATIGTVILRVEEYVRADGSIPYRTWFEGLEAEAAAKVAVAKIRLSMGNTSRVKWFDGIGEYVIDWGPGYRVYLARDGDELIILYGGGTKRRQQADIDRAKALHAEYRVRKAAARRLGAVRASRPHGRKR